MDLKVYYQKMRDLESKIPVQDVYVVSLSTPDGGRDGVVTQVPRRLGCQLIVEGRARLAGEDEIEQFEREQKQRRLALENEAFASRIQVRVVTDSHGRMTAESDPVKE